MDNGIYYYTKNSTTNNKLYFKDEQNRTVRKTKTYSTGEYETTTTQFDINTNTIITSTNSRVITSLGLDTGYKIEIISNENVDKNVNYVSEAKYYDKNGTLRVFETYTSDGKKSDLLQRICFNETAGYTKSNGKIDEVKLKVRIYKNIRMISTD